MGKILHNKFNNSPIAKPSLNFKNTVYKKIDSIKPDQFSSAYEIVFIKDDGNLQPYIEITNRNFKMRTNK